MYEICVGKLFAKSYITLTFSFFPIGAALKRKKVLPLFSLRPIEAILGIIFQGLALGVSRGYVTVRGRYRSLNAILFTLSLYVHPGHVAHGLCVENAYIFPGRSCDINI